eukprot:gnl/MRDRNA2_/MRDRNA2_92254_c0_seq1.p1 gnl/MRDRNA2_/MRDRNA2_92254_c0~~gnl/MRDRNA2_/MRDRNA2_92254_c0_seq1.p1  ORF type:complete len:554 (+),score=125.68 gnl/MRDRNA2_/MRDRNA2_92254_c0_seq1:137-1798(+)
MSQTAQSWRHLPPCTCHMVLLGHHGECKRSLAQEEHCMRRSQGKNSAFTTTPRSPAASKEKSTMPSQSAPISTASQISNQTTAPGQAVLDAARAVEQEKPLPTQLADLPQQNALRKPSKTPTVESESGVVHRRGSKKRRSKSPNVSRLPSIENNEEKKVIQRKLSKNSAFWRGSGATLCTLESVQSPRFMWDKYLKHFTPNQLDLLYEQFEAADEDKCGRITADQALGISADWNELNHELENVEPPEDVWKDILVEIGKGQPLNFLNFEQLVSCVRLCEAKVLQMDPRAGFSDEDLRDLSEVFEVHSKERVRRNPDGTPTDETRRSLSTQDVFEVLQDIGRDTSLIEQQMPIVDIIKQMDADLSGDLDWGEFLQFIRQVRQLDAVTDREIEHKLICETKFNDAELEDFQMLFMTYADKGVFYIDRFVELVESNNRQELDKQSKSTLKSTVRKIGGVNEDENTISFGQFLGILKNLLEKDVCGMKSAGDRLQQEMEEDKRFLSPEEFDRKYQKHFEGSKTSSWVRRMLDNKSHRRLSRQAMKDAEALKKNGAGV